MALPPGVYFYPTPEECVSDYLDPWWRGEHPPGTGTLIFDRDVYGHGPDALRRAYPPATARGFDLKWYFFTTCRLTGGRGSRVVQTGGYWKVEQKSKAVAEADGGGGDDEAEPASGQRRTYGFHIGGRKTAWLMEEFTSDEGGRHVRGEAAEVPMLCRIYVSPRASDEDKREILGDDAVAVAGEGRSKRPVTVRVALDEAYYHDLTARLMGHLIPGDHGQGAAAAAAPPPVFPPQAPPPLPIPDLHHPQAAPPPAIPYHHHPQAAPPQVVPAHHHHPQAAPPPLHPLAFPVHQPHPQAAPPPVVPRHHHPRAAPPQGHHRGQLAQHAHRHGQSIPPTGVHRYHHGRSLMLPQPPIFLDNYPQPAPSSFLSPKKEEEEEVFPAEKKPRLTYDAADAPTPQPQVVSSLQKSGIKIKRDAGDQGLYQEPIAMIELYDDDGQRRDTGADATAVQEPEPAPAAPPPPPPPTPPQENAEQAASPPLPEATLHPPSPGLTFDASQEAGEAWRGGFMDMEEDMVYAAHAPAPDLGMIPDCQCPSLPVLDDLYPYNDLCQLGGVPEIEPPSP